VGKGTMQFGRKQKPGIRVRNNARPEFREFGLDVPVKGGVDLDHIEAARHELERMLFAPGHTRWIKDAFPVLVRPSGRAYTDSFA